MREIKGVLIPRSHNLKAMVRDSSPIWLEQKNGLQKCRPQYSGVWPVLGVLWIKRSPVAFPGVEIRDFSRLHTFPRPLFLRGPARISSDLGARQYWSCFLHEHISFMDK